MQRLYRKPRSSGQQAGFTMVELMMVIAVLGILMAVAVPTFRNAAVKSNRATVQSDLLAFAQAMEKEMALNFSYAGAAVGTTFPSQSPLDQPEKLYNLSIVSASTNASEFLLRATPIAGTAQAGDGIMEINHLGQRFWDKNNDGDTADSGESNWAAD